MQTQLGLLAARPGAQRKKVKTTLADYNAELKQEQKEEEDALALQAMLARRPPPTLQSVSGASPRDPKNAGKPATERYSRALQRDHIMPLVDLAYSEAPSVQRSAIGLLATLSINQENKDMLLAAGTLKPLLASSADGVDLTVRRHAFAGLAHMTVREDIRHQLCAVTGGVKALVQGVWCADVVTRLAAAECVANVAASMKLRGKLVDDGVLPALASLLTSRHSALKRLGMVALQRLAASQSGGHAVVTKEDPEGDGYAMEIMDQVRQPATPAAPRLT